MNSIKKFTFWIITQAICFVLAALLSLLLLKSDNLLVVSGSFQFSTFIGWTIYITVLLGLVSNIIFSHKYGKLICIFMNR